MLGGRGGRGGGKGKGGERGGGGREGEGGGKAPPLLAACAEHVPSSECWEGRAAGGRGMPVPSHPSIRHLRSHFSYNWHRDDSIGPAGWVGGSRFRKLRLLKFDLVLPWTSGHGPPTWSFLGFLVLFSSIRLTLHQNIELPMKLHGYWNPR